MPRSKVRLGGKSAVHQRHATWRWVRLVIISAVVITVLIVGLLLAYAWYAGQQEPVVQEVEPAPTRSTTPTAPPEPADDMPVSIVQQTIVSPVAVGDNTALSIKTLRGAACSIEFTYNDSSIKSRDSGLIPQTADEFGMVEWTWTVTADTQPGAWPAEVTCALNDKSAYLRADITVE